MHACIKMPFAQSALLFCSAYICAVNTCKGGIFRALSSAVEGTLESCILFLVKISP